MALLPLAPSSGSMPDVDTFPFWGEETQASSKTNRYVGWFWRWRRHMGIERGWKQFQGKSTKKIFNHPLIEESKDICPDQSIWSGGLDEARRGCTKHHAPKMQCDKVQIRCSRCLTNDLCLEDGKKGVLSKYTQKISMEWAYQLGAGKNHAKSTLEITPGSYRRISVFYFQRLAKPIRSTEKKNRMMGGIFTL